MKTMITACVLTALIAVGLAGCSKESDQPQYITIQGNVTHVDQQSGTVEVEFYSEKHQEKRRRTGKLAPNAEVLVNGATTPVENIFVGELVNITARLERQGDDKQFIATKVEVIRKEPKPTTKPPA